MGCRREAGGVRVSRIQESGLDNLSGQDATTPYKAENLKTN